MFDLILKFLITVWILVVLIGGILACVDPKLWDKAKQECPSPTYIEVPVYDSWAEDD